MDREELTRRLRAVFLEELTDHLASWDAIVLRLERGERGDLAGDTKTLFRIAHSLKGAARSVSLPTFADYCHGLEEALSSLREAEAAPGSELLERLLAATDVFAEVARRLGEGVPLDDAMFAAPRASRAPPRPASLEDAGGLRVPAARLDELLLRSGELSRAARRIEGRERFTATLLSKLRRERATRPIHEREPFDRVLDSVGELHARLVQDVDEMARMARRVDQNVRQLRLTPFRHACQGLERAARDAAKERGREVELVVSGGDVEIDRSVLTGLRAPLMHLVRNAVGHGVEDPPERARRGKPARGRVSVSAAMRGAEVDVEVVDDGNGIDLDALAERARLAGIEPPDDAAGRARLVFEAGLSTAAKVDHLSGRGVGLDVVKSEIEALHGTVRVETWAGKGTRFVISAPLTRTVVRALLVRSADQLFALPTTHVLTLRRVDPKAVHLIDSRPTILHEGVPVPLRSLARALDLDAPRASGVLPTVVVHAAADRVAFTVDAFEAVEDAVVEGLGPRLARVRNIAGAATLEDGRIALVLHGGDLVRSALRRPDAAPRPSRPAAADAVAPRTLLVVDDSLTTLALEKTILEAAGYRVIVASDGERALRIVAEGGVDLVVSDVEMPRVGGLELTRVIRSRRQTEALPVVLLTGLGRDEDRERGLDAGADAYLVKNAFDQTELLEVVARLLEGDR